jgi:hypothetical protein
MHPGNRTGASGVRMRLTQIRQRRRDVDQVPYVRLACPGFGDHGAAVGVATQDDRSTRCGHRIGDRSGVGVHVPECARFPFAAGKDDRPGGYASPGEGFDHPMPPPLAVADQGAVHEQHIH